MHGAEVICRPSALLRSRRHLGADQPGPGLRQPRLRGRRQRHRHRPGRRALLRQLDDRHADRRGRRPGRLARGLGQRARLDPATALRSLTPGRASPQGVRPPRRPQPGPDPQLPDDLDRARQRPRSRTGVAHFCDRRGQRPPFADDAGTSRAHRRPCDLPDAPEARDLRSLPNRRARAIPACARWTTAKRPDPGRHRHRRHVHRRRRGRRGPGELRHDQDAVHARRPGRGLPDRRPQGARPRWAPDGADVDRRQPRHHGGHQPAARGQGRAARLHHHRGLRVPAGDRPAEVPDGYGNSYFWVKPPRIVPADLVRTVGGRLDHDGRRGPPVRRGRRAVAAARCFRDAGHHHDRRLLPALLRQPDATSCAMREVLRRGAPRRRRLASRSEVLREYREYERAMTTLVDAAVKPQGRALRRQHPRRGSTTSPRRGVPFYVMKSNGGVLSADEVVHQPITTVLSGPAAGALGAALVAGTAGFDRVLTCDGGGTSTDVTRGPRRRAGADHRGHGRRLPVQDPDDRRRHRRRRRRLDRLALARGHAQGRPAVGRRRPGPDLLRPRRHRADRHRRPRGARPDPAAPARRRDAAGRRRRAAPASTRSARQARPRPRAACATGILEISAWNQANALRQITVKRGLDVRDFALATFGGSGSLLACRLVDILGLPAALVPPEPGQPVGVRAAHRRRHATTTCRPPSPGTPTLDLGRGRSGVRRAGGPGRDGAGRRGLRAAPSSASQRTADLRYFGQAFEVRVAGARRADRRRGCADAVADAFHDAHRAALRLRLPRRPAPGRSSG